MFERKWSFIALPFLFALLLVGCSDNKVDGENNSEGNSELGDELNIAINTQPVTLDNHMTTATITQEVGRNIYEKLVELNSDYEVVNMLAETVDESEDGKIITFHLRQGVEFHNGKEMKAEDVVASLVKWQASSPKGQQLLSDAEFIEIDEYTVELRLPERLYGVVTFFADVLQSPVIMPKEVAEEAGPNGATEYIGTGPFKFVEWVQDQYIHLSKFENYQSRDGEVSGLSGPKEALVNDLYFHIVTDSSTRVSGVQTGQYDIGIDMPRDNYLMLENAENLVTETPVKGPTAMVLNKKEGLFSNIKFRQAVNVGLDLESIMLGAYVEEKFYRLDSNYMLKEQEEWATTAGSESYNQNDIDLAKSLLEESAYDGTPLRLITTREYDYMYNSAVIIAEQLESLGINVDLQVYDWATVLDIRGKSSEFEAFITSFPPVSTPTQLSWLNSSWAGWTDDPKIDELMVGINRAGTPEEAFKYWEELQGYLYEYVPVIKLGDNNMLVAYSNKIQGLTHQDGIILWNTSISK